MKRTLPLALAALLCVTTFATPPAVADDPTVPPVSDPVVVDELTDEYNLTIANGDGTYTLTSSREAQRVERDGAWVDIDPSVQPDKQGRLSTRATLADMSFSNGGDGPLAITTIDGKSVELDVPFTLPAPSIDGNTITYPDVLPDVDLVVQATAEAFSEVLVVKTPEAARNPELAAIDLELTATGLTIDISPDGATHATDEGGDTVFYSAPPTMWDSTPDAGGHTPTATTASDTTVTMDVTDTTPDLTLTNRSAVTTQATDTPEEIGEAVSVTVEPDLELLTGQDTVYPVFIDPSFSAARANFTVVRTNAPTYANNTDLFRVGYCGWSDCGTKYSARSYFNFNTPVLAPRSGHKATIYSASLNVTQIHNGSSAATGIQLHRSNPFTTTMAWPGTMTTHIQTLTAAGTAQLSFTGDPLKAYVQDAANAGQTQINFALRAPNENDMYQWKKLANNPTLTIRYSFPVTVPTVHSISPTRTCNATTYVTGEQVTFRTSVQDLNPTPGDVYVIHRLYRDGKQVDTRNTVAPSGVQQAWTPVHRLSPGAYTYTAQGQHAASDGTWQHGPGVVRTFNVAPTTAPAQPTLYSSTHPASSSAYGNNAEGGRINLHTTDPNVYMFTYAWNAEESIPRDIRSDCSIPTGGGYIAATNGRASLSFSLPETSHTLYVRAIGINGQPSPTASYPINITPSGQQVLTFEAEDIIYTKEITIPYTIGTGLTLGAGKQVQAAATTTGQQLTLEFNAPNAGPWIIQPTMTKAPANAIIKFSVNGQDLGREETIDDNGEPVTVVIPEEHDLYAASSTTFFHQLENQTLNQGSNTLTITVIGKNAASTGRNFAVDQLRLIRQQS